MNPLHWSTERKLAALLFCALGALGGLFFAWLESPLRALSTHSLSGEWSDYTNVFLMWLSHWHFYWPWLVLGATAAALGFYAVQLSREHL
jgi:hypothetical protein